ncbi:hypothetical protein QQF64_023778 [Cirrhinus molitorella]|uniref:Uncharacterized protein n=1 Tax=Cirrhinus molitorella TaxID=172907 RepID=A0ABR3NKJ2_9TELE
MLCQVFPGRREEFDLYLAMMADFNKRYGGTLFYEDHKSFSAKSASFISLHNFRLNWAVPDTELLVRHFGGHKILACAVCSSYGHSASFCPKVFTTNTPGAIHGAEQPGVSFDFLQGPEPEARLPSALQTPFPRKGLFSKKNYEQPPLYPH